MSSFYFEFSHIIASITTTSIAINLMSIAVEVSCHWSGEVLHSDGMNVRNKTIIQSHLTFIELCIEDLLHMRLVA